MEMTMLEYLEMVGREKGRQEGRKEGRQEGREEGIRAGIQRDLAEALASLRKAMTLRGIDPAAYAKDLRAFRGPGRVSQLIVSFMAAKNPRAYLKRRFGH